MLQIGLSTAGLLDIFQQVPCNFSKRCSKEKLLKKQSKVAFCNEIAQKLPEKTETFFGLMLKFENCTTKILFLSIFVQFCGVTKVAK